MVMPSSFEVPMDVVRDLTTAIDALCAADPSTLADGESIVALHREAARLQAALTRATAAYDAGGSWAADGARSSAAWVAVKCGLPLSTARRRVRLGRCLRSMPATEAAWLAGDIGQAQVSHLAEARSDATAECFARDEEMLVGQAKALAHRHFLRALHYWSQHADPDGVEDKAAAQHRARRVHLSCGFEGSWFLDGVLDPISGDIVSRALKSIEEELFAADWAEAKSRVGEGVCGADLGRTPPNDEPTPWWRWPARRWRCLPAPACPSRCSPCWWATRRSRDGSASWPAAGW